MEEYVQAKRSTRVNFQLKMCNLPFVQEVKSKLRDKGYQEVQERSKLNLSLKQIQKIFKSGEERCQRTETVATEQEVLALKKVFVLAKRVPRNGIRIRWRESGNYQPNMLSKSTHSKLFKGDMVFVYDAENALEYFIVSKDFEMNDITRRLPVHRALDKKKNKMDVDLSRLVMDKGFILTVPSNLFSIVKDQVIFNEAAEELLDSVRCQDGGVVDEDLELLHENPLLDVERVPEDQPGPSGTKRKAMEDMVQDCENGSSSEEDIRQKPRSVRQRSVRKKTNKRKRQISDDDDNDNAEDGETESTISFLKHNAGIGDYVAVKYEGVPFMGQIKNIDASAGFQVKTLINDRANCFMWSDEKEDIWYKSILFVVSSPSPANSRGAWEFSECDFEKFKSIL